MTDSTLTDTKIVDNDVVLSVAKTLKHNLQSYKDHHISGKIDYFKELNALAGFGFAVVFASLDNGYKSDAYLFRFGKLMKYLQFLAYCETGRELDLCKIETNTADNEVISSVAKMLRYNLQSYKDHHISGKIDCFIELNALAWFGFDVVSATLDDEYKSDAYLRRFVKLIEFLRFLEYCKTGREFEFYEEELSDLYKEMR